MPGLHAPGNGCGSGGSGGGDGGGAQPSSSQPGAHHSIGPVMNAHQWSA